MKENIVQKLSADLSKYKDSMRPLIERDMEETEKILMNSGFTEVISLNNIFYFANENTETKAT